MARISALAAAAACLVLIGTPADAATGTLIFSSGIGQTTFIDPAAGCYATTSPFTTVTNHTNVPVTVYESGGCFGPSQTVPAGSNPTPVGPRRSVSIPS
ncbi:hypothetical protein DP939_21470 [Spongiactinospora rosea]|uniref:Uncharacterized protein n=1 Tax=Spongiactinospora rosea TaxID=2248750 RepID=A0A366LW08_9ACTN|nr:hypothetical protein [Spongiactinospora rosea]RBQ17947.1 hypothetical protein DP939_21470 [Spongiactinospora rosea]